MNPQRDAQPFTDLLDVVAEHYDVTLSAARKVLYFDVLSPYPFETVSAAIMQYMRSTNSKFGFPRTGHIVEIIEGSDEERDANAWAALTEACRRIGNYPSVIVEDPALAYAIMRKWGTWAQCQEMWGTSNDAEWSMQRRDFVGLYRIGRKSTIVGDDPVCLLGRHALENNVAGVHPPHAIFGAILLDGRIESRYLPISESTGVPAMSLRDVIALPPARTQLQLPASTERDRDDDIPAKPDPDRARKLLRSIFDEWNRKFAMTPTPGREKVSSIPGLTPEEEERRKAVIRAQAREIEGRIQSTETLRGEAASDAGRPDRSANHGRGTAAASRGTSVSSDQTVGVRSRVAGAQNRVGDRGRDIRRRRRSG